MLSFFFQPLVLGGNEISFLMHHEVTAPNLDVNWQGVVCDPGMSRMGMDGPGLVLLCAVYSSRPDQLYHSKMHTTVQQ